MASRTTIRIRPFGRMANLMGQLMFCLELQRRCRQPIDIEGHDIPDWKLKAPTSDASRSELSIGDHLTRLGPVRWMIDVFRPALVHMDGLAWRESNFSTDLKDFFPFEEPERTISDDTLLVHVRSGDVSVASHPLYGPLPLSYFRYLAQATGLKLAFIGELDDTDYVHSLRRAFPSATYLTGGTPRDDFQTIRSARNVAIGVSSFSWLAAYLSPKAEHIHVPLAGHFDPLAAPKSDLIPIRDRRFVVHRVPRLAWDKRHRDYDADAAVFAEVSRANLVALKSGAFCRTLPRSARIHLGLLRRMAFYGLGTMWRLP
jgi:hypothetical protein